MATRKQVSDTLKSISPTKQMQIDLKTAFVDLCFDALLTQKHLQT